MKLFCFLQNRFKILGVYKRESFETSKIFNIRNSLSFFYSFLITILSGIYLVCETHNLNEKSNSLYSFTCIIAIVNGLAVMIWRAPNIYSLIESYEEVVNRRKHFELMRKMNGNHLNEHFEHFIVCRA